MEIFKSLGAWMLIIQSSALGALTTPGLLPTTGRWVPIVTYIGLVAGIIGTAFAKKLIGKSDELRLAETLPDLPHDRRTDKPPEPPVGALLLFFLFTMTACAGGEYMFRYDQSVATANVGALACKDTLSDVNDLKIKTCRKILDGGDAAGADQCLTKWIGEYKTANDVCSELKRLAQAAFLAREVVATAPDAEKQAFSWTAKLLAQAAKVAALYAEVK